MIGLKLDINNQKTRKEQICQMLTHFNHPLKRRHFKHIYEESGQIMSTANLGMILHGMVKEGVIGMVKYQGYTNFYGFKRWIDQATGFFKPELEFDPAEGIFYNSPIKK